MPLLKWLADDVTRVANTRTSHLSLQFTHGCYQKSLGLACTWIMQSTSWVKIFLVITDAYSKYPCIHPTSSTSTRATLDLLEEDFAHFGFPHTLVTDNAPTFTSEKFQHWCKERGITHLTGAPYHPASNGAAERLVQTFKQALKKSSLPPKNALQEFLMQYRRTPTSCGFSPSELLNSRQLPTRIDSLLPSPAHIAQGRQSKETSKSQMTPDSGGVAKVTRQYKAGDPAYALYTMDLAETSILVGYLRSSRSHWVLAASTSRSFLMAQFGDDTGSSCSHATLLMRTTNLVMLWTTFLNCRRIIPWRYRGLHHRFRDIPGPRLYHLTQSTDRTIPDDREGHVNPTKDIVVDA